MELLCPRIDNTVPLKVHEELFDVLLSVQKQNKCKTLKKRHKLSLKCLAIYIPRTKFHILPPRLLGMPAAFALFGDVMIAMSEAAKSMQDWLRRNMLTKFFLKDLELIITTMTNEFPMTPAIQTRLFSVKRHVSQRRKKQIIRSCVECRGIRWKGKNKQEVLRKS